MNDQAIMENLLLTAKGACDLYMHGAVESGTQNVHATFNTALNDTLCMQDQVYRKMSEKGWYTAEQADQTKIDALKQKFGAN